MATNISNIVHQLLEGMHTMSMTETIIGEPLKAGDATIVPIHRLRIGFAAGTLGARGHATPRRGESAGRAAGASVQIDPVAAITVSADGTPRILAVDGEAEGGMQRLLEQVPDLLLKVLKGVGEKVEKGANALEYELMPKELRERSPSELTERK